MSNERSPLQYPLHVHPYIEITYLVRGKLDMNIGGRIYHMTPGDLAVIFPNVSHDYHTLSDEKHTEIHIGNCYLQLIPYLADQLKVNVPSRPVIRVGELHKDARYMLMRLFEIEPIAENLIPISAFYSTLLFYCYSLTDPVPVDSSVRKELPEKIIFYISEHYLDHLTLDKLAKEFGVSRYVISRIFTNNFGVSFSEYVNSQRINYSKFMLLTTEYDITHICYESGFHNQQSFNRIFRSQCACTPTEYRIRHRGTVSRETLSPLLPKEMYKELPPGGDLVQFSAL